MAAVKKTPCKYGSKCYRRNPKHFEEFSHEDEVEEQPEAEQDDSEKESPKKAKKVNETEEPPKKKPAKNERETEESPKKKPAKNERETEEPQKKKARTIDDFFKKKNPTENVKSTETKAENIEKTGNISGYVRKEEEQEDEEEKPEELDPGPASPSDVKENIKAKYDMEMPSDFYLMWDFASTINKTSPKGAFKKSLGLRLVGPYDILAGTTCSRNSRGEKPNYHLHWRYYYDPPEFMTVLKGDDSTQFHIGYYRDDPSELPAFVASNSAKENGTITPRGDNLFAALIWYIDDQCKKDPSKKGTLKSLKEQLQTWVTEKDLSVDLRTKHMKARDKKVVCRTFHGAGIVVPVDANEVGYREVPETPGDLKKMLKKIVNAKEGPERDAAFDPLMEILMLVQFANDECDYGMGLELGLDLFSYGDACFHPNILNLLPLAYTLLGRHVYKDIIAAHMKHRSHSAKLSQFH